jgi:class 3 adenylate cyclase/tetratricopeptide (TPR) repeat protein
MTSATAREGPATQPETAGSQAETPDPESIVSAAQVAAQKLLRMGEPLLAYNELQQALELKPADFRLRQLQGLALTRSGALRRANEVLAALRQDGCTDAETMGPLARTHKDLALAARDPEDHEKHLVAAHEIYEAAYRDAVARDAVSEAYYTGINAATMALLRRHVQQARRIAAEVEQLCRRALAENPGGGAGEYWPRATLAEAALILGELDIAKQRYRKAAALAGTNYGDLSSTRHQARILLDHLGIEPSWLDDAIRIPPVLVFTGHMIDAPGRNEPRFPPHMAEEVRRRIRSKIERIRPAAAYGSAACGADILCLEVVRELGGELHIVLPFPAEQFRSESVEFCGQGDWGERFQRLLDDASEVMVISEKPPPCGASTFEYANLVMTGLARLRSQVLDTKLHGIAVWDGSIAGDVGGTSSVVDMWREYGVATQQVDPRADTEESPPTPVPERLAGNPGDGIAGHDPRFQYAIRAMLFADAVGYTRLSEGQIPLFFEHYLGAIAAYNRTSKYPPEHIETAGDGMYMVFDDPHAAGHYALELSELIAGRDWPAFGLPANLSMRVGLHCGPVYIGRDPITGSPLYTGIHTSRTARIEPITPPGQVYASGAFAAVAAARCMEGLRFSYIGRTQLAKQYGALALYHVKRP